ncbi:MAG TPA: beta-propeller domain-containing protein, partial [Oscillospiraceae bacterium]|nr:beta-propeller domain-containing protein [Oscillospiraceae bacterium]
MNKKHENNNELTNINETLKKAENLTLPSSLSEESINELLGSQKPAYTSSKNSKRKRAIAFAAVLAIVFSALIYTKPWQNSVAQTPKAPIKNLSGKVEVPNTPLSYKQLEDLFIKYKNANTRKHYSYSFGIGSKTSDSAMPGLGDDYIEIKNESAGIGNDESTSYGKTNEQVAGVNEADIIKNDGTYIYMAVKGNDFFYDYGSDESVTGKGEAARDMNIGGMSAPYNPMAKNSIAIIKPSINGQMQVMSTISAEVDSGITYQNIINMYVKGNRLHAIYDVYGKERHSSVLVVTFDITNKQKPIELRRFYQSGSHISTRLIENSLILITNHHVAMYDGSGSIRDYCIPETGTVFENTSRIPVDNICIMESAASPSYLVASNINLDKPNSTPATAAILGAGDNIYATTNNLYVTNGEWDKNFAHAFAKYDTEIAISSDTSSIDTNIYAFDITKGNVIYKANKAVNGSVLNQFSIDEYDGHLRIATTTGNFEKANNFVYVLSADTLQQVGIIKDIAPGESIKSVRFMGSRGYVVTFLQTDPLFVIDLANPSAPKILGELKITGFSSYLHPITSTLLAGIGVDGTETGQNNNLKVSLFDVSDPSKPKEVDKAVFGNGTASQYAHSIAYYDHKAISYDDKESIFYFPLQIHDYIYTSGNNKVTTGIIGLKID